MVKRRDDFSLGLETILNSKQGNFLTNPKVFSEIQKESGMSLSSMVRNIGKQSKNKKEAPPTDKERSEARLKTLEQESEKAAEK